MVKETAVRASPPGVSGQNSVEAQRLGLQRPPDTSPGRCRRRAGYLSSRSSRATGESAMSDALDPVRRELQQRLESTRAAAQEHERVRTALEALEHAVKPFEEVTRRAAGGARQRGRPCQSPAPDGPASCRRLAKTNGHTRRPQDGFWVDGECRC